MPIKKLNDLQLILLSTAANRDNGTLLPAPDSIAADEERLKTAIASLVRYRFAVKQDGHIIITNAGRAAIGVGLQEPDAEDDATHSMASPTASNGSTRGSGKIGAVLTLLCREEGATLAELVDATGWLPHTIRAALTGLRKKGHVIDRNKRDNITCYHIRDMTR